MFLNNFKYTREELIKNSNLSKDEKELALDGLYSLVDDMRSFGVNDSLDIKDYFYIKSNATNVLRKVSGVELSDEQTNQACKNIFSQRRATPIDSLYNMYCLASDSLKQLNLTIKKIAYPQGDIFLDHRQPYNINNWLATAKEIVKLRGQGIERDEAVKKATSDWDNIQQMKFDQWLSFYEQGEHMKYKMAQILPENLRATIPGVPSRYASPEIPDVHVPQKRVMVKVQNLSPQEAKDRMQSRLNSIEKLFSNSDAFRRLLGNEFAKWLEHFHALKRVIQLSNPRYVASKLFQDLIYREGNKLHSNGFVKSAQVMFKLAQDAAPPPPGSDPPPSDPSMPSSDPSMPSSDPSMTGEDSSVQDPKGEKAMEEFVDNINGDFRGLEDLKEPEQPENMGGMGGMGDMGMGDMGMGGMEAMSNYNPKRIVRAQVVPEEPPLDAVSPEETEQINPNQEELITQESEQKPNDVIGDDKIENALSGVTLDQATMKAEYIAQLYKSRLISRELQILDLYLQALDIDMYFNQELSEALNRALDSNQYGLTRVENILAKLRGASSENISIEQIRQKFNQKVLEKDKMLQDKVTGNDKEEEEKTPTTPAAEGEVENVSKKPPATQIEPEELQNKPEVEQPNPGVRV